ncbi:MAG: thioredoxin family protein, partial [Acidobacteriota bacterium]
MRIHPRRIVGLVLTALCCAATLAHPAQEPDYEGYYAKGTTFAAFLEKAKSRRDEWRAHYNDAAVTAEMMTRMRAIPERRRILVVAEDWCGDSVNTVPYLARLVDGAPERLDMRLIDSKAGRTI